MRGVRLGFFGAVGGVTGSSTVVEAGRARVTVDFGLFQGKGDADRLNRVVPTEVENSDAVILTHAHLDHSGRLPMLCRARAEGSAGFGGPIFATPATIELAEVLLKDSAYLQQMDAERDERAGRTVAPLYGPEDVEATMRRFRSVEYGREFQAAAGVRAMFVEAGHILGSASVMVRVEREGRSPTRIAFSGDVGVRGTPMLRDPQTFDAADVVVLESTYGDRDHRSLSATVDELEAILRAGVSERSRVLIPSFAVGRTQQMLHHLGEMKHRGALVGVPVFIDSPMATEATSLYRRHAALFDDESHEAAREGRPLLRFSDLTFTGSPQESRAINERPGPLIVIAASGMLSGGRILHHLRHGLWRAETRVIIVGFQPEGGLGRRLIERAERVTIMGEPVVVKAKIHTLGGLSAHAGQSELLAWLAPIANAGRPLVLLNHGEDKPRGALAEKIRGRFGLDPGLPGRGMWLDVQG